MRRTLPWLKHAVALVAAAVAVHAGEGAQAAAWTPSEDDTLLLELHSGKYKLGQPLRGYQTPDGTCVDFADLIQALDLPVRLDKKSRRATGWLFAEDQRLIIDRDANTVQNMNGERSIPDGAIHDTPEGWCMDTGALSAWFGVRFKPDLRNLALVLESDRKLPFLEAIERRSRAAQLRTPSFGEFDLARLPQAELPYRNWRTPSVDVQLQASWHNSRGAQVQYEALASGEALGLSYNARLAGNLDGSPALRLKLFRNDPAGGLLGPLGATQVALGDVETQRGGLTGQGGYGRGAFISNRPLNLPGRFGKTTLRGTLPAGWDAELYRNGELRAWQADRGDGRYEFAEIELLFGDNEFDVVLYGPQGQVRHERSSLPVGIASIPAGKTWYWAGIVQQNRDLIDFSKTLADPLTGWRWGVGVERGIDKRTTVAAEYQSLMLEGRRRDYIEASVRRALGPVLLDLSGAQQLGGGRALRGQALGRIGGIRFDAQVLWVDGAFESELVDRFQSREYSLRANTRLNLGKWQLPIEGGVSQKLSRDGEKVNEWLLRGSVHVSRVALTAELLGRSAQAAPGRPVSAETGTRLALVGNTSLGKIRLRGSAEFGLGGGLKGLQRVQMVAEAALNERSTLRAGIEHEAVVKQTDFKLAYIHQFDRLALRFEGKADTRGRIGAGLTLAFSLGPDPVDGGWRMTRDRLAEEGQAAVEVFRDDNGDGYRQADEGLVEGVVVEAGFRHTDKPTNKQGRAVINGLRPYVPVLVSIDGGSLADPLLQPKGPGRVVVPRPGIAATLSLPLAPTGEIEALVLGSDGEPRGGIEIELVDASGIAVRRAQVDFDGYLLFDAVPYGDYRLRVAPASAAAAGLRPALGPPLRIDRANPSLRLGRIRVENAPPPAQVARAGP